ncbi:MAG: hypothetical protein V4444_02220 [Pseudomonadota bacterium]
MRTEILWSAFVVAGVSIASPALARPHHGGHHSVIHLGYGGGYGGYPYRSYGYAPAPYNGVPNYYGRHHGHREHYPGHYAQIGFGGGHHGGAHHGDH